MLVTLIVLYVGSQLVSTVISTVSADKTQKYIMYGLPFFFVVFVFEFPAGLLLYWITTNLWTIAQQLIVRRRLGPLRPPPEPDATEEKRRGRLETARRRGRRREAAVAGASGAQGPTDRSAARAAAQEEEAIGRRR